MDGTSSVSTNLHLAVQGLWEQEEMQTLYCTNLYFDYARPAKYNVHSYVYVEPNLLRQWKKNTLFLVFSLDFFFCVVLGFELMVSHLLGRCSFTT
jgi:hypothetical protein